MSRYLSSVHWDKFSLNLTANTLWDRFCDMLNMALEQFAPVKYTERDNTKKQMKH